MSQQQLAASAGILQETISRLERGNRKLSPRVLARLITVLGRAHAEQEKRGKRFDAVEEVPLSSLLHPKGSLSEMVSADALRAALAERASWTIEQRLQFEKNLLEGQLQGTREVIAGKDAQIATLIKALDAALQANADYAKLFALKGASVAADELQQEIETRQRNTKESAD